MSGGFFASDPDRMPLERLLAWTGQSMHRFSQRTAAAHGLTATSLGVLGVLADTDAVSHRELSGHLGLTPATLTPVVDALESAGELTRERDPSDRRVVRLSLTPRGRERLQVAFADVARTFRERMPDLDPEHAAIVRAYLLAVLAAVEEEAAGTGRSSAPAAPLRGLLMDYAGVITDGPEVLELARRARAAGVATALVTDAHAVPDACTAAFDLVVLGPALGARKPDPELYRRVAERLGLPVEECVVVDDHARNVGGARAAGAVVVHHQDADRTVTEVEILLELPARH